MTQPGRPARASRRALYRGACGAIALLVVLAGPVDAESLDVNAAAVEAVAETASGGRSLFDCLVASSPGGRLRYDIPFPFAALLRSIRAQLTSSQTAHSPLPVVLIPRGRSLQRAAAAPDFFKFPRLVAAAVGEPAGASGKHARLFLRDRLFLGYQPKADAIEVISYNETAGRFEFQVVQDYRRGAIPRVVYASRPLCLSCHQNAAPIFSRQPWSESTANVAVTAALKEQAGNLRAAPKGRADGSPVAPKGKADEFNGAEVDRGLAHASAIDSAAARANLFAAYQQLWRRGCQVPGDASGSVACRAGAFALALRYRLSGENNLFSQDVTAYASALRSLDERASTLWPDGLAVAEFHIPDRNPFLPNSLGDADLEPILPRSTMDQWSFAQRSAQQRLARGIGQMLAATDVRTLDKYLFRAARSRPVDRYSAACSFSRHRSHLNFHCASKARNSTPDWTMQGRLYLVRGKLSHGAVDNMSFGTTEELRDLSLTPTQLKRDVRRSQAEFLLTRFGLHARRANGNALISVGLSWDEPALRSLLRSRPPPVAAQSAARSVQGVALLASANDFAQVLPAIASMAAKTREGLSTEFSDRPFRAAIVASLFKRLGLQHRPLLCPD